MAHFTAVYDACMLYPAPLRSLLMYLALTGLIRARWTDAIHEEWMRNVVRDYPDITREKAERVRDLMNAHVRDCLVTGYEDLIPALKQAARPATGRRCLRCRRRGRPGATSTAPRRLPCTTARVFSKFFQISQLRCCGCPTAGRCTDLNRMGPPAFSGIPSSSQWLASPSHPAGPVARARKQPQH